MMPLSTRRSPYVLVASRFAASVLGRQLRAYVMSI